MAEGLARPTVSTGEGRRPRSDGELRTHLATAELTCPGR
jgi:hypothetical protein